MPANHTHLLADTLHVAGSQNGWPPFYEYDNHVLLFRVEESMSARAQLALFKKSWRSSWCDGPAVIARLLAYQGREPEPETTYWLNPRPIYMEAWREVQHALLTAALVAYDKSGDAIPALRWHNARHTDLAATIFKQSDVLRWAEAISSGTAMSESSSNEVPRATHDDQLMAIALDEPRGPAQAHAWRLLQRSEWKSGVPASLSAEQIARGLNKLRLDRNERTVKRDTIERLFGWRPR